MYKVSYNICPESQPEFDLVAEFDDETFLLVKPVRDQLPEWTSLGVCKCEHCPLAEDASPRCPLAQSLVNVIDATSDLVSHTPVALKVIKANRTYLIDTTAQDAVRSFMGLIIPASGCPHTAFFRPMSRFHLPCSDEHETLYRSLSMYTLAGQIRTSMGLPVNPGLEGLAEIYANINKVNYSMAERLRTVCGKDSSLNAITMLDVFAQILPMQFEDALDELLPSFGAYSK